MKSLVLYTLQNYPAFYRFKTLKFIGFLRFIKWCSMLSRKNSRNHFFKHKPGNISKSSDQNQKSFSEIYFFHTTELWPKYEFDTRQKKFHFWHIFVIYSRVLTIQNLINLTTLKNNWSVYISVLTSLRAFGPTSLMNCFRQKGWKKFNFKCLLE